MIINADVEIFEAELNSEKSHSKNAEESAMKDVRNWGHCITY